MRQARAARSAGRERRWAPAAHGCSTLPVILGVFHFYGSAVSSLRRRGRMISGSPISCRPRCECQGTPDEEGDGSCKGCRAGGTGLGEHHSNEEGLSSGQGPWGIPRAMVSVCVKDNPPAACMR